MEEEKKSSGVKKFLFLLVLAVLVVAGFYLSVNSDLFKGQLRRIDVQEVAGESETVTETSVAEAAREDEEIEKVSKAVEGTHVEEVIEVSPKLPADTPVIPKQIFNDDTFKIEFVGGLKTEGGQILFENYSKQAVEFKAILPEFNSGETENKYDADLTLEMCEANLFDCREMGKLSVIVFKEPKNETYVEKYTIVKKEQLTESVKYFLQNHDGFEIFFRYSLNDPNGAQLYSPLLTVLISQKDKVDLLATPIQGNVFDESSFLINQVGGYTVSGNTIKHKKVQKTAIKFEYTLPLHKPGNSDNSYFQEVALEFCDATYNCIVVPNTLNKYYVFKDGSNRTKYTVIQDKIFDKLLEENDGLSQFRYRITDPTGSYIYSNIYQIESV